MNDSSMEQFEAQRPLMFAIAYRMLGSAMEAEDIVQEAFIRYQRVPAGSIISHKALLTTMVTRQCINALQSARVQRESYIGPWLPEPLLTGDDAPNSDETQADTYTVSPSDAASIHESLSLAFLVLLESLTPVERAVFLLREVFDYEYAEIAMIVGKEEAACRQSFSRAKKHIVEHRPRFQPSPDEHRQMLANFMRVIDGGDLAGLVNLLAEDVTLWADGGGKARGAATRPLRGAATVAQFAIATTRLLPENLQVEVKTINGEPAIVLRDGADGRAFVVISIRMERGRIAEMWTIGNPDKLKRV